MNLKPMIAMSNKPFLFPLLGKADTLFYAASMYKEREMQGERAVAFSSFCSVLSTFLLSFVLFSFFAE